MKKNLLMVAVAFATLGMVACRSTKDEAAEAREKLNNLIVETHNPIKIEKSGNGEVDSLAGTSTVLYDRVRKEFDKYVERTRGSATVMDMTDVIYGAPDLTDEEYVKRADDIINGDNSSLTAEEKKSLTPQKLYQQAKEKIALQDFIDFQKEYDKAEDKAAYLASLEVAEGDSDEVIAYKNKQKASRDLGKKLFEADLAKDKWAEKIAVVNDYLSDAVKIASNAAQLMASVAADAQGATDTSVSGLLNTATKVAAKAATANKDVAALKGITKQADYSQAAGRWLLDEYLIMKMVVTNLPNL